MADHFLHAIFLVNLLGQEGGSAHGHRIECKFEVNVVKKSGKANKMTTSISPPDLLHGLQRSIQAAITRAQ